MEVAPARRPDDGVSGKRSEHEAPRLRLRPLLSPLSEGTFREGGAFPPFCSVSAAPPGAPGSELAPQTLFE